MRIDKVVLMGKEYKKLHALIELLNEIYRDIEVQKIILSPHIDDAILSLGGSILKWIGEGLSVKVVNIFSRSLAYNGLFRIANLEDETRLRKNEELDVIKEVGDIFEYWDFPATSSRRFGRWLKYLPVSLQVRIPGNRTMLKVIAKKLGQHLLSEQADVYLPIAHFPIAHIDHVLVRDAALAVLRMREVQTNFWLYEDMPYCARDRSFMTALQTNHAMSVLIPVSFDDKARLARKYQSQVKETWLDEMRLYHEQIEGERVWQLKQGFDTSCLGYSI